MAVTIGCEDEFAAIHGLRFISSGDLQRDIGEGVKSEMNFFSSQIFFVFSFRLQKILSKSLSLTNGELNEEIKKYLEVAGNLRKFAARHFLSKKFDLNSSSLSV